MRNYNDLIKLIASIIAGILWSVGLILLILSFFNTPSNEAEKSISDSVLPLFAFGLGSFYIFIFAVTIIAPGIMAFNNKTISLFVLAIDLATYLFLLTMGIKTLSAHPESVTPVWLLLSIAAHIFSSFLWIVASKFSNQVPTQQEDSKYTHYDSQKQSKKSSSNDDVPLVATKAIEESYKNDKPETAKTNSKENRESKTLLGGMYVLKETFVLENGDTLYKSQIVILDGIKGNNALVNYKNRKDEVKTATIPISFLEKMK